MQTPNVMLYTRRLVFPHLTVDTMDKVSPTTTDESLVALAVEQCYKNLPATFPGTIGEYAVLGDRFMLWMLRDGTLTTPCKSNGEYCTARADGGGRKLTADEYMGLVNKWEPDGFVTLASTEAPEVVTAKSAKRCTDQTLQLLDACLQRNERNTPAIATIAGQSVEETARCAIEVASRERVAGYMIDVGSTAQSSALTQAASSALPPTSLRISHSLLTPDQIISNVGHIDIFSLAFPYMLAQTGYAINLSLFEPLGANEIVDLTAEAHKASKQQLYHPLRKCECWACEHHNRAYIYHLLDAHEMLGWTLLAIHNMHQCAQLLSDVRSAIDAAAMHDEEDNGDSVQRVLDAFLAHYQANVASAQKEALDAFYRGKLSGIPGTHSGNASTVPPTSKGSDGEEEAGYPGRVFDGSLPPIDETYTYRIDGRNPMASVCEPQRQKTPWYTTKHPMATIQDGETMTFQWKTNGHYNSKTKKDISVYCFPPNVRNMNRQDMMAQAIKMGSFSFDSSCRSDRGPEDPWADCQASVTINKPQTYRSDVMSCVWFWPYDSNPIGEEYTTCFDVHVLPKPQLRKRQSLERERPKPATATATSAAPTTTTTSAAPTTTDSSTAVVAQSAAAQTSATATPTILTTATSTTAAQAAATTTTDASTAAPTDSSAVSSASVDPNAIGDSSSNPLDNIVNSSDPSADPNSSADNSGGAGSQDTTVASSDGSNSNASPVTDVSGNIASTTASAPAASASSTNSSQPSSGSGTVDIAGIPVPKEYSNGSDGSVVRTTNRPRYERIVGRRRVCDRNGCHDEQYVVMRRIN
ncbi:Queuine tRNA-ribosyltransferase subunit qtrtd1 [Sorochytrium milnesiophthora]